jgi:hypothetical protein
VVEVYVYISTLLRLLAWQGGKYEVNVIRLLRHPGFLLLIPTVLPMR